MLSDEEKKAIQMIKNQKEEVDEALIAMEIPENYIGEDVEQEYLEWQKNADIILNLIEKQQKEIKNLKEKIKTFKLEDENIYLQFGEITEKKRWQDKIKAKIEEIDEVLKGQLIEKIRVYFEAQKEVLKSLLDKEE